MPSAKVGRRGSLVIPAEIRREVGLEEGDVVKVTAEGSGKVTIERLPSLREVQERISGKLPQWRELEGVADELVEEELKLPDHQTE